MLRYFYFLTSILFLACKSKQIIKPNQAPSAVIVTSTLAPNGKDLILNWTKSEDPDGDAVTYSVIYKDTLAKGLKETKFIIKDLPFGTSFSGTIVATDTKGLTNSTSFSSETASAFVKIPDPEFEQELINQKIDDIKDGQVSRANAEKVNVLKIDDRNFKINKITSLDGIDGFINLEGLYLFNMTLVDLKIPNINKLKVLHCSFVYISNLDVSKNVNLTELFLDNNQLKNLDISKNVNLTKLNCRNNLLSTLDVSKNLNLTELYCHGNKITELDVSKNVGLNYLWCSENKLTTLDISRNGNLKELFCEYNQINKLDFSKNGNLAYLHCHSNELTILDVSKNVNLKRLNCSFNKLTKLDVSKSLYLTILTCFKNQITHLDVSENINLADLSLFNNQLSTLDLSNNSKLTFLLCYENRIKTICVANLNQPDNNWRKDATTEYKVCN